MGGVYTDVESLPGGGLDAPLQDPSKAPWTPRRGQRVFAFGGTSAEQRVSVAQAVAALHLEPGPGPRSRAQSGAERRSGVRMRSAAHLRRT